MSGPSILYVDHRAPFWERMSRNYRYKHERLIEESRVTYADAASLGHQAADDDFDILLVGAFGFPLHPLYPAHGRIPDAAFGRARASCLLLEDMHDATFLAGRQALCQYINRHFDYLIAMYDCEELDGILQACPRLRNRFVLPHHVNTGIFRDYGLEKRWDVLFYGDDRAYRYPFRRRLRKLLETSTLNVEIVEHPGRQEYDPERCGESLARLINRSRIAIATPSTTDYLLAKYFEIAACRSVIAGEMASAGKAIWRDDYIHLDDGMTDAAILHCLEQALHDREALEGKAGRMYRRVHEGYSLERFAEKLMAILDDCAQDGLAARAMRTTGAQ